MTQDIENGSTIQQTLRFLGGGHHDQPASVDPSPKKAKTLDPAIEEYLERVRIELQSTLNAQTINTQDTFEAHTNNKNDQLMQQIRSSITFMDEENDERFKNRGLEQLEQAKRTTSNDMQEDTERSIRAVATGFPPDTTEAIIKKFFQDVLQQQSLTGQVVFGIGPARWPGSPSPSEAAQWFNVIPVSGVGEVVGGVSQVVGKEKIGGNGVDGMFSKDMTDGKCFLRHAKYLEPHV